MNMNRRGTCFEEFIRIELVNNTFVAVAGFCFDSLICSFRDSRGLLACVYIKK